MGTTFGRGAATTAMWDMANADCVVVMGSNMAENHPIAFRFLVEAQRRGAVLVHVDPRFTRTSALADIHAPIRSGSDIAFLGGIIHQLIERDLWFRDYAMAYTNISHVIADGYADPEQGDGLFSGFDADTHAYGTESWQYADAAGQPATDPTLQHPNCVYQILRRHYSRYTPEMVEQATGCPKETFLHVVDALAKNSGRERTSSFCYAVGWTHSTVGVQIIRAASIVQGLLGNIGRPGGGIQALRGHISIQGSTDIPTLYDMLPTYLPQPNIFHGHATLAEYIATETPATGWLHNFPKYIVSLLKAWYGADARADNQWGYQHLPKLTGDVSQSPMTMSMEHGLMKGQFILGQNPAVGSVNAKLVQRGLAKLDWLVVRDFALTETADFWQKGHLIQNGEMRAEEIGTEVFFLPAALVGEKDGSVTNTNRLVQWHDAVLDPPGDTRSELWFIYHLGRRLKELYAGSTQSRDAAINALTWDYPVRGVHAEPEAEAVLREINGYTVADRRPVAQYQDLRDDGSTACGGWAYCGVYPRDGHNVARSRTPDAPDGPGSHLGWAFSWPSNRRTLYNRASADPKGKPWSERKKMVWWDEAAAHWTGTDVPDFVATTRPDYRPDWSAHPQGMAAIGGDKPFIMQADGNCQIFVPHGLKDGPLPTHYEPQESPVHNPLYAQQSNPTVKLWKVPGNELHAPEDPRFPYIFTTYRLTELHCGGIIGRVAPHTAELQPEAFVELSPELAELLGIVPLGWCVLSTLRGEIEVRAMVTRRLRPFVIGGRTVHQVGMPYHYGWDGYTQGEVANVLLAITGDANTSIHSTKAVTCNLRSGRRA